MKTLLFLRKKNKIKPKKINKTKKVLPSSSPLLFFLIALLLFFFYPLFSVGFLLSFLHLNEGNRINLGLPFFNCFFFSGAASASAAAIRLLLKM